MDTMIKYAFYAYLINEELEMRNGGAAASNKEAAEDCFSAYQDKKE